MKNECEHRWVPQGNGISICELCADTAFSGDEVTRDWPDSGDESNDICSQ